MPGLRAPEEKEYAMKVQNRFIALVLTALLLSAAAALASTTTDYDHKADFARYKTYSWAQVQTSNSLWDQRVKDAVNSALAAKGWTEVPSGGDAVVCAHAATREQHDLETFYNGFGGWRWRGFGGSSTTTVNTYKVGTLVVDLFDAGTHNLLWRGTASDTLSSNAEKNTKKLDKNVNSLFKHFPPTAKS
jgi:Domain of unknown function (DUF4136)